MPTRRKVRHRAAAVGISNRTAVRRNPEVLLALSRLLKVEKNEQLRKIAENVWRYLEPLVK